MWVCACMRVCVFVIPCSPTGIPCRLFQPLLNRENQLCMSAPLQQLPITQPGSSSRQSSLFSSTVQMYRFVCYENLCSVTCSSAYDYLFFFPCSTAYAIAVYNPIQWIIWKAGSWGLKLWRACGSQACGSIKINLGGDWRSSTCHHWGTLEQGPLPHYHN